MGESLDMLRFAALSSSVHADAVQCLVDDTQRALSLMTLDDERLNTLETKLLHLTEKQKRFEAMRKAVSRSRSSRCPSETAESEETTNEKKKDSTLARSSGASHITGMGNVLQFASSALEGDEIVMAPLHSASLGINKKSNAKKKRGDTKSVKSIPMTRKSDEAKHSHCQQENLGEGYVDEEVLRTKAEIAQLESMSIKTKLRNLEALKQEVKEIDADAILEEIVTPFAFSSEVEDLWTDGGRGQVGCENTNMINALNIDFFISRACEHFTGRYEDALDAIEEFTTYEERDPVKVFGSLQYAKAMTDARNCDTDAVQQIQGAQRDFLITFYKTMRSAATVSMKDTPNDTDSVLGDDEFCVLPADWQSAHVISVPSDTLLPPARHILSPRFSFADTNELKSLQSLRVDLQRDLIDSFIGMGEALGEMERLAEDQEEGEGKCDSNASLIRVLAGGARDNVVWTTLAQSSLQ